MFYCKNYKFLNMNILRNNEWSKIRKIPRKYLMHMRITQCIWFYGNIHSMFHTECKLALLTFYAQISRNLKSLNNIFHCPTDCGFFSLWRQTSLNKHKEGTLKLLSLNVAIPWEQHNLSALNIKRDIFPKENMFSV